MWTYNRYFTLIFILFWPIFTVGQNCSIILKAKVTDAHSYKALNRASVYVLELERTFLANAKGELQISGLCQGDLHLEFSSLGYTPRSLFIKLLADTTLTIDMHSASELIDEVELHGKKEVSQTQSTSTVLEKEIENRGGKGLAKTIEGLTGVSSLSNGAGISKPVIHGLWGNRVSIINNGIAQSGQQWGSDHAPEIDPFVANHISVLKGASALAYAGVSLGGVVLVEQNDISEDPHIHGKVSYIFESNGFGNTLNARIEQAKSWGRWRVNATAKLIGDRRSPDYYLTNTGNRETNIAAFYQKKFNNHFEHQLYYSLFNTQIGTLRGSHISNSTDLESALSRDEPFFTKGHFSYAIEAPQQQVQHHLVKYRGDLRISDTHVLKFRYGGQWNNRQEFDVRRSGRSEFPALSMQQVNQFFEVKDVFLTQSQWFLQSGLQYTYVNNSNDNEATGRMPLIPDYQSNQGSVFSIAKRSFNNWKIELGARVDYKDLYVLSISQTIPREIERHQHYFLNYSLSGGLGYTYSGGATIKLDLGYVQRQPEVNELYSSGLHQGLASLEYGNPNLQAENSFKGLIEVSKRYGNRGFFQMVAYYQHVNDYIFLEPTGTFENTISGSFPVFVYNQTNATIYGSDLAVGYNFTQQFRSTLKVSLLRGDDQSNNVPLIYMPANNGLLKFNYDFKDSRNWTNTSVGLLGKYVARQNHLNEDQDFLAPPDAYFLLGAEAQTQLRRFTFALGVDNMLNTVYRDYLNRLRYFADEMGMNIQFRLSYQF